MKKCLVVVALCAVLLPGCRGGSQKTVGREQVPKKGQLSKAKLRDELVRFEYFFVTSVKQIAEDIDAASQSQRQQRVSLHMQTRIFEALYAMTSADDPIVAFLDTWGLIIRLRTYLETGGGSNLYGANQQHAIELIRASEEEINRIGRLFLDDTKFSEAHRELEIFAHSNPITGTYSNLIVYPTQEQEKQAGAFMRTLSIPMAPIRAMEGVDNTATAIHNVRDSVDRFTNVTQQLPESTRWQMSILMDDFEEAEMTQSFLNSLDLFAQSSARLVELLDTMPAELRTELLTVLEESGQTQQQFQTTLQAATQAAVQLEKTLGELQTTTLAVNQTAAQTTQAAAACQNASDSIQELVGLFKTRSPRSPDAPPPFGMRDFDTMLLNAGQTADKVTQTVAQFQQTVDDGVVAGIERELRSLVDHIAWRLFQLMLAAFAVLLAYRVMKKILNTRTPGHQRRQ